jgi:hypothetical protein
LFALMTLCSDIFDIGVLNGWAEFYSSSPSFLTFLVPFGSSLGEVDKGSKCSAWKILQVPVGIKKALWRWSGTTMEYYRPSEHGKPRPEWGKHIRRIDSKKKAGESFWLTVFLPVSTSLAGTERLLC